MVKLLLVVSNNLMHGTERYVLELAEFLPKNIYDVYIATPCKGPLSELILQKGLKEITYDNDRMNKFTLKGSLNLFREIKKHKFDIIQANSGIVPCIIGKLLRVKLCLEIKHGIFYSDTQLRNISKLTFFKEYVKQFFVDYFIAISENDKQRLVNFFKIKASKIKVIYNGLNTHDIDKQLEFPFIKAEKKPGEKVVIGTIGRYNYQKAYDIMVEAVQKVAAENNNIMFQFIGTGEEELKIKALVREKNLNDFVNYIGYTIEIFKYLSGFDIFVLTSRYEGVPYVLLEAMYLGVPIICTKVGGIDNILTNEETAILTECDSPTQTSEAILKLISDPDFRKKISANSKKLIKRFTAQKMADDTSGFYLSNLS